MGGSRAHFGVCGDAHNLPTLVRDHDRILDAIEARFGPQPSVEGFHSVSALTTLLATDGSRGYARRVPFDPPVCKAGRNQLQFEAAAERTAAMTRRRTDRFESEPEFVDALCLTPACSRTAPRVGFRANCWMS